MYGIRFGCTPVIRQCFYAKALEVEVEDVRGRVHHLTGFGRTSFPWQAGPGTVGYNVLAEWRRRDEPDARGWGEIQEFVGPQFLTDLYSARAAH